MRCFLSGRILPPLRGSGAPHFTGEEAIIFSNGSTGELLTNPGEKHFSEDLLPWGYLCVWWEESYLPAMYDFGAP